MGTLKLRPNGLRTRGWNKPCCQPVYSMSFAVLQRITSRYICLKMIYIFVPKLEMAAGEKYHKFNKSTQFYYDHGPSLPC